MSRQRQSSPIQFQQLLAVLVLELVAPIATAQQSVDWPSYGGDLANSKYSPLDQINRDTIQDLEIAWVWNSPDDVIKAQAGLALDHFKATPLIIDGVLYVRMSNIAEAIDAETGATLWGYNPESYRAGRPASYGFTTRGLAS